ncbi:MAG: hypothetical protein IT385_00995 [Deltaproteobacteria bacterium]|nr:hypothetical protein [Deltaproteobacteria bacterium]
MGVVVGLYIMMVFGAGGLPSPAPTWHERWDPAAVARLPTGVALPYPTDRLFRGFGACRGRGGAHRHAAIDLGGVGPDGGLGTPIRSMVRARVTMIGRGSERPKEFGAPDKRRGLARRKHLRLPRSRLVPGYGEVFFFSATRGRWRSGTIIETVGLEPPLDGATIRYMHLGAVRPDLAVGAVVDAGEELGLMGGTGVQRAGPHVHIDIVDADDVPVDVAALIGLAPTARCGAPAERAKRDHAAFGGR